MILNMYSTGGIYMTNKVNKCSLCGMCNAVCPIFRATLHEGSSPRGKAILIKQKMVPWRFYDCTLCGACVKVCPAEVDMELRKVRKQLVSKGYETEANKKMIENIRTYGNPFGEKKDPDDDTLYCC